MLCEASINVTCAHSLAKAEPIINQNALPPTEGVKNGHQCNQFKMVYGKNYDASVLQKNTRLKEVKSFVPKCR
jgi:hypothetical protein